MLNAVYCALGWTGINERTFIAIKPDGVQRKLVGEIIGRFERKGFRLVALKLLQVWKEWTHTDSNERGWCSSPSRVPPHTALCDVLVCHCEVRWQVVLVLPGHWRAAEGALLGPEEQALLQRLGQVHELWTNRSYGKVWLAFILVSCKSQLYRDHLGS